MEPTPLPKPAHLHDAGNGSWLAHRPFALAALVLGVLVFVIAAITNETLWSTPDPRITAPGFGLTAIASGLSVARRERAWTLWLLGLGAAGAALVLGWFLLVVIVLVATAALLLILNTVM